MVDCDEFPLLSQKLGIIIGLSIQLLCWRFQWVWSEKFVTDRSSVLNFSIMISTSSLQFLNNFFFILREVSGGFEFIDESC